MPEQTIKFLAELNSERFKELGEDIKQDEFPREDAFLDVANSLVSHDKVRPELLRLSRESGFDIDSRTMALYLLLAGDNKEEQLQAMESLLTGNENNIVSSAVSLLEDDKALAVLDILFTINTEPALSAAAEYLLKNKVDKTLVTNFVDDGNQPLFEDKYILKYLSLFGGKEVIANLVKKFEAYKNEKNKLKFARALVLAQEDKAVEWLTSDDGMYADRCKYFPAVAGVDSKDKIDDFLNNKHISDEVLAEAGKNLFLYGAPWAVNSYFLVMSNRSSKETLRQFHQLFLTYFSVDDEKIFKGIPLIADEELSAQEYKSKLTEFWLSIKKYVNGYLKDYRYFFYSPFSVLEVVKFYFDNYMEQDRKLYISARELADFIFIWTGKYVYFDDNALLSKQSRQQNEAVKIIKQLELTPGKWLRWGEYQG